MSAQTDDELSDEDLKELEEAEASLGDLKLKLKLAQANLKAAKNHRRTAPMDADAMRAEVSAQDDVDRLAVLVAQKQVDNAGQKKQPANDNDEMLIDRWLVGVKFGADEEGSIVEKGTWAKEVRFVPAAKEWLVDGEVRDRDWLTTKWLSGTAGYAPKNMESQLDLWVANWRDGQREVMRKRLNGEKTTDAELRRFLTAIAEKPTELDVAVWKQMIWLTKRKLADARNAAPVAPDHIMMTVLVGKTDAGKTVAMKRFVEPLEGFYANPGDTKCLGDGREAYLFRDNYALVFDELAKLSAQDYSTVKGRITAYPTFTARVLGSMEVPNIRNNATLLGTSEKSLGEVFHDPAGMRRFWETKCKNPIDWAVVNAVDPDTIWRCVSADDPCPVSEHWPAIRAAQDAWRARDTVEQWLELGFEERSPFILRGNLVESYEAWWSDQNGKPLQRAGFYRRLEELGAVPRKIEGARGFDLSGATVPKFGGGA